MKPREIDARPPVRARTSGHIGPLILAACCVLAVVGAVGYLAARALAAAADPPPALKTLPDIRTAAAAVEKVRMPRPAVTKSVAVHRAVRLAARPDRPPVASAADAMRSPPARDADPGPVVIYKSADMSDAEFAAWQRRKAAREGRPAAYPRWRVDPANVDDPRNPRASDSSPPSAETLRLIERANR